jgi:hypothetical protein
MNDTRSSSPLRHLDISDDAMAADLVAEKARQLVNAYEHIEELREAVKGLLGLIDLVARHRAIAPEVSQALTTSNIVLDARELLR